MTKHTDIESFTTTCTVEPGSLMDREVLRNGIRILAAALRALLAKHVELGLIPAARYTVAVKWSGCTPSVVVTIRDVVGFVNLDHVIACARRESTSGIERYTAGGIALRAYIYALLDGMNYNRSDYASDYFDVGFYVDVLFDRDVEAAMRDALTADVRARAVA